MDQAFQVFGALLILIAFAAAQMNRLDQRSYTYLLLNLVGSAILAYLAFVTQQWGFVLLETVWAAVSLWGIYSRARGEPASPS